MARAAGVSTAVVSYVLNDGPRPVSAEAKQRVLAAIKELGRAQHARRDRRAAHPAIRPGRGRR
ncbi:LacI family DNA-binding transcriptional regulator [Pseudonocardia sp. DSM 110487]|uniref:LacI family DNA-binding transcriptional regulator n=1 Tax=Pseudonocardia sp. DSM 110487 TaxID=2865833 RepID=UPI00351D8DD9